MTGRLRTRLSLLAGRVPRYVTIGERDPQQQVRVTLEDGDQSVDVTRNHAIVSLRPLRLAIGNSAFRTPHSAFPTLRFSAADGATLGEIWLSPDRTLPLDGEVLQLYRVERHLNHCMKLAPASFYALYHAWASLGHRPDFEMARGDRLAFEVLYICPRPAVLVSVEHDRAGSLFPMDLIGPTAGGNFLMALKTTSRSIGLMLESGRMALADMPMEYATTVTMLGGRDKKVPIDWDTLAIETGRSPRHGLRVPAMALRVRDVVVRATHPLGSHTLFVTDVVGEQHGRDGLQMHTISGPYYHYLRRHGVQPPQP